MSEEKKEKLPGKIQVELALSRTLLAADRTLLAWIRTSLAMFGFGFTLAKFIHSYIVSGGIRGINPDTSRAVGIAMLALGLLGLIGGIVEHYRILGTLKLPARVSMATPSLIMAVALCFVGVFLVYDILTGSPP